MRRDHAIGDPASILYRYLRNTLSLQAMVSALQAGFSVSVGECFLSLISTSIVRGSTYSGPIGGSVSVLHTCHEGQVQEAFRKPV